MNTCEMNEGDWDESYPVNLSARSHPMSIPAGGIERSAESPGVVAQFRDTDFRSSMTEVMDAASKMVQEHRVGMALDFQGCRFGQKTLPPSEGVKAWSNASPSASKVIDVVAQGASQAVPVPYALPKWQGAPACSISDGKYSGNSESMNGWKSLRVIGYVLVALASLWLANFILQVLF